MDITCPCCRNEQVFDDIFTRFEDCGDYVNATATHICPECDYVMTVHATFLWDNSVEVY